MKVRQSSRSGRSFVALLSRPAGGSARASPAPPNLPGARTIRPAQLAGLRRPALALRARQVLVALPVGEPSEHCSWCARGRRASLVEPRRPSRASAAAGGLRWTVRQRFKHAQQALPPLCKPCSPTR